MKHKLAVIAILLVALATLWFLCRQYLTLEAVAAQEHSLRTQLANRPITGFVIAYLVYVVVSLVPGTTGKSLIFGWLFGLWQGVLLVNLGLTTAAMLAFLVGRYLIRDAVQSKFGYYLHRVNEVFRQDGASYLFTLRMMHAPFTVTNYVMSATSIRTRPFWWATQLGMLPGNILFVYAGTRLPTIEEASARGVSSVFSPQLVAIFMVIALFPFVARWAMRCFWKRQGERKDDIPG